MLIVSGLFLPLFPFVSFPQMTSQTPEASMLQIFQTFLSILQEESFLCCSLFWVFVFKIIINSLPIVIIECTCRLVIFWPTGQSSVFPLNVSNSRNQEPAAVAAVTTFNH